jgi:hypothetical protein
MKSNYITIIIAMCSGLATTTNLRAQDPEKDIAALVKVLNAPELSMKVAVYRYASETDQNGSLEMKGEMRRKEGRNYMLLDDAELLQVDDELVLVNHDLRTIQYSTGQPTSRQAAHQMQPPVEVDPAAPISFMGLKNGVKQYRVVENIEGTHYTDFYIEAATGYPKRIEYFYPPDTEEVSYGAYKVSINYTKVSTSTSFSHFKLSNYISKKGGRIVAAEKLSGYQCHTR